MKLRQVHHNKSKARRILGLKGRPFGVPAESRTEVPKVLKSNRGLRVHWPSKPVRRRAFVVGQYGDPIKQLAELMTAKVRPTS